MKLWEVVRGGGDIPISVVPTHPLPSKSKPVLEIITSMNLLNPTYQPPGLHTVQVQLGSFL